MDKDSGLEPNSFNGVISEDELVEQSYYELHLVSAITFVFVR